VEAGVKEELMISKPLLDLLLLFYRLLGENLGVAIIAMTVFIRLLLLPLTLPSIKATRKIRELGPELEELKKKYKKDKQALAQAQLKLYQKHGVNPAAGCLPQIVQIVILIALFQAFRLALASDESINRQFFYLDLTKPDLISIPSIKLFAWEIRSLPGAFLIGAAVVQFLSSRAMMGSATAAQIKAKETEPVEDDIASSMQKQMLYMMPIMTLFIGLSFPSGLVLYWLTFSAFLLVQQLILGRGSSEKDKNK
jgi:YidC/Oxa1 family membrane protein insertase